METITHLIDSMPLPIRAVFVTCVTTAVLLFGFFLVLAFFHPVFGP